MQMHFNLLVAKATLELRLIFQPLKANLSQLQSKDVLALFYLIVAEFEGDESRLAVTLSLLLADTSCSPPLRSLPNLGIRLKRLASLFLVVGDRLVDFPLSSSFSTSASCSVFAVLGSRVTSDLNQLCEDDIHGRNSSIYFLAGEAAMMVREEDPSWSSR